MALIIVKIISTFSQNYVLGLIGEKFSKCIRELMFNSQMHQSMEAFNHKATGKYLMRYSGDLLAIQQLMNKGILMFLSDIIFLLVASFVLAFLNPILFFCLLIVTLISGVLLIALNKKLRRSIVDRRNYRSIMLGWVASRLFTFTTIKSFNREVKEIQSFRNRSEEVFELGKKVVLYSSFVKTLYQFLFMALILTLLFLSLQFFDLRNPINQAKFFTFLLIVLYTRGSISRISKVTILWQVGTVSLDKLLSICNLDSEQRFPINASMKIKGEISFNSLIIKDYKGKFVSLNNVEFPPKSITQIVYSPVAIPMVFDLIQKKKQPDKGYLLFDQISQDEYNAFEIRKNTTVISLEVPLIGSTLFKAVSYRRSEKNREKLRQLMKELNFNLTQSLEDTLNFKIGDFGSNLPLNDRIMLLFIRAFMTQKKILLIDDVLHYLSQEHQESIVDKLNALSLNKTIIIFSKNSIPSLHVTKKISL